VTLVQPAPKTFFPYSDLPLQAMQSIDPWQQAMDRDNRYLKRFSGATQTCKIQATLHCAAADAAIAAETAAPRFI